jgi:glycosyltransferase involved in cell wall biosynthesis
MQDKSQKGASSGIFCITCMKIFLLKVGKPGVIVSVTSDLATDQRVKRICGTLHDAGYEILLRGRILSRSLPVEDRPYRIRRIRHFFNKGALFYAEYNLRLFIFLLFGRYDILHSNDLDTLPANYLASLIRRKILVYDSHEYFTEVAELKDRNLVRKTWEAIEKIIFPRLDHIITVSGSIAGEYMKKYGKRPEIIRNFPETPVLMRDCSRSDFGIPSGKKLIILQGTGINRDRGAEEAVESMEFVKNAILLIAGTGDVIPQLREQVHNSGLNDRVIFIPPMPYRELMCLTGLCDAGLSLDRDTNLNHRFSLPNKLFDYIMAGIPVVASPLPEISDIVEKYGIGMIVMDHSPAEIARAINSILDEEHKSNRSENLKKAASELNWEKEKHKLIDIYNEFGAVSG